MGLVRIQVPTRLVHVSATNETLQGVSGEERIRGIELLLTVAVVKSHVLTIPYDSDFIGSAVGATSVFVLHVIQFVCKYDRLPHCGQSFPRLQGIGSRLQGCPSHTRRLPR